METNINRRFLYNKSVNFCSTLKEKYVIKMNMNNKIFYDTK